MSGGFFPTWFVDGPLPLPPVHGLIPAAAASAAGVRFVVDVTDEEGNKTPIETNGSSDRTELDRLKALGYIPQRAGMERWLNGVAVYPYPVDVPETWDACDNVGSASAEKSFGTAISPPDFAAFTITLPITCTSQQVPDQDAFKARAVTVIAATESYAVEQEFLTGAGISGQPYLADQYATFPNGGIGTGATSPIHGLQVLEYAIALTGRLGLIHCSPMLATALLGNGFALKDNTGVIRTINGNVVIPGFGYAPGATPVGAATPSATSEWAYATGPIDIRRSEIFTTPDTVTEALDRSLGATNNRPNTITYRAERYYAVDADLALQAAVLIDRCSTTCVT